jgi:hypothetical protein
MGRDLESDIKTPQPKVLLNAGINQSLEEQTAD